jgi:hypothetical protein
LTLNPGRGWVRRYPERDKAKEEREERLMPMEEATEDIFGKIFC